MGHGSIPVQAEEGLAGVQSQKLHGTGTSCPLSPVIILILPSCPQEPGHGTQGIDCQKGDSTARASGA